MGNNFYNLDKLIKISVFQPKSCWYYKIKKEIKIFGFVYRKGGVYNEMPFSEGYICPVEEFEESHTHFIIHEGEIYEKPSCVLRFQDEYSHEVHFNEYKEAFGMARDIQDKLPNLISIEELR